MSAATPPNFPSGITVERSEFKNWAWTIDCPNLWTCKPSTADDVVKVCNWAKAQGYKVRPRGMMHTWSELTVVPGTTPDAKVILVDTTAYLTAMTFLPASGNLPDRVKVQTGATMDQLLASLERQQGGGYSFPHVPAPGDLSVGGVLAIDAHGTAIPRAGTDDDFPASYGSLSNQILEFTAVVTDPSSPNSGYALRTFTRGQGDDKAFLTHLGRAFLVDATLQVVPNYYLRCQSLTSIPSETLFQAPSNPSIVPENSFASFLEASGRVEVIWFPFSWLLPPEAGPWLKVWTVSPQQPSGSRQVGAPYNYEFSDQLTDPKLTELVQDLMKGLSWFTPLFGYGMGKYTADQLSKNGLGDLWGPSKNTLLYIKPSTLRYAANGYAVQMKKSDVQQAVADFAAQFRSMLDSYARRLAFPINGPLEIRVTALDDPSKVGGSAGTKVASPVISALSYDSVAQQNGWDVALWFDVLTLPGTAGSDGFYQELEQWLEQRFAGDRYRVMVEWSKGWAYSNDGPWTNPSYLETIRQRFTTGRSGDDDWNYEVQTLNGYDAAGLFSNSFLDSLFQPVS